ncbi:MAG: cation-translocating P-type ATPase [Candidatus Woesearchaeota archaeon]
MNYYDNLTEKEADKRLKEYGLNALKDVSKSGPLKIFLRQVKDNFIVYLLLAATILSFIVGKDLTAYTILVVIVVIIIMGFVQEYKAEKEVDALKKLIKNIITVVRGGEENQIESSLLVPGDIILLKMGEKVPADCVVLEEKELGVDESTLTGESLAVNKSPCLKEKEKHENENMIFAGTYVVNGKCTAKVLHTGMNTAFGKISKMISKVEKKLPLQIKVNNLAKYMVYITLFFAFLTGFLVLNINKGVPGIYIDVLILMIAFCVAAFPEGFPVVLTIALTLGAKRMSEKNAIVNRMSVIETLGETTVICSDKTGTITKGEMTVKKIYANNSYYDVTGSGYSRFGIFLKNGKEVKFEKNKVFDLIFKNCVLCNDAKIKINPEYETEYKGLGSPTEIALMVLASKANYSLEDLNSERIEEINFNSSRKMMTVLNKIGKKKFIFSKGAPEIILHKCSHIYKNGKKVKLTKKEKEKLLKIITELNSNAMRTIGLAYKDETKIKKENFENNLIFLGILGLEDAPREEVKESISKCFIAGIKVKMITGDNYETAVSIGKQVGLEGKVLTGIEMDELSDEELKNIVNDIVIFARVRPEHKLRIVNALKENGEIVTMTGDGVNDAPALKEAHIGVAMGKNGTDVSRSVADLTLKDDHFNTIVEAIKEGRTIFNNIRKFTSYLLTCKFAEISILFLGVLLAPYLGWQVPFLLAIHILFMNLVTDDLPAMTLSVTPSSEHIMQEKPRKNHELMTRSHFILSILGGLTMCLIVLSTFYISFNLMNHDMSYSRTMALLTLICIEIANAFNFMSFKRIMKIKSFLANKYLFFASIISIIATILIIYTPLNKVFETIPLAPLDWIIALSLCSIMILFFNLLKYLNSKFNFLKLD